ncbi:SDR family oxidoreductase [Yeosuana sp. MJ-SS3]|uniref:SDR family oxidoreductase n=1 Tax=Gilvirhabdus luticola TaxID=3079858 RepID=A0ABU3U3H4_9FLAO|nr:NAD-dependent epimerase/dehydratase family protein [Yeosuana sp. MJ-SS3]MDU8884957.1 SDR family oxidoreductase [Yeosuana sp. MJ-SS3]
MVLVTGGTGLIGSHLLYKLIKNNEQVKAIYRTEKKLKIVEKVFSYYTENYKTAFEKIEWIKSDLLNIPSLTDAFKDVTHVYHCAAFVSFEPDKYHLLRQTNIEGTANIVNLCVANGIKKLCYVSSIAAVGEANKNGEISEKSEWNKEADNSVYAITKYGAEMEVWRGSQEGLDVVIVNPGVVLGAGIWSYGSGSIFNRVYKGNPYYTNGTIGLIDIEDVVNIMINLIESNIRNERFILIAENWTYKKFLQTVAEALYVKKPYNEAKKWQLQISWRLDWLIHKLKGRRRRLTRQLVKALMTKKKYNNQKIKSSINYSFKPIDKSISEVSQVFLKEV